MTTGARRQRRRVLAHQCPTCRRHWALHVVAEPVGSVIRCRYCGTHRPHIPLPRAGEPGTASPAARGDQPADDR